MLTRNSASVMRRALGLCWQLSQDCRPGRPTISECRPLLDRGGGRGGLSYHAAAMRTCSLYPPRTSAALAEGSIRPTGSRRAGGALASVSRWSWSQGFPIRRLDFDGQAVEAAIFVCQKSSVAVPLRWRTAAAADRSEGAERRLLAFGVRPRASARILGGSFFRERGSGGGGERGEGGGRRGRRRRRGGHGLTHDTMASEMDFQFHTSGRGGGGVSGHNRASLTSASHAVEMSAVTVRRPNAP